jgi:hypothetical protein
MALLPRLAFVLVLILAGCDTTKPLATPLTPSPSSVSAPALTPAPGCPVTLPGAAGKPPFNEAALFGGEASYGNDALWVGGLWPHGVIAPEPDMVEPDGSVQIKMGWYRITEGTLSITGRRVDGSAPALGSHVPDGYGRAGFQSSGLVFPTAGCWEVTGHVSSASMTFVVYVLIRGALSK